MHQLVEGFLLVGASPGGRCPSGSQISTSDFVGQLANVQSSNVRMLSMIKIRKGLNLPIAGAPEQTIQN
ncbi:MAG: hypothetical protein DRR42_13060, partial [Gammaproteobacteria bacterium]